MPFEFHSFANHAHEPAALKTSTGFPIELVAVHTIRPHEEIDQDYGVRLCRRIERDGMITRPVVVEAHSGALLDGHHRLNAAKVLGLTRIPAVVLNYDDPRIELGSWREDFTVTRELVLTYALEGRLMPKKTSRHSFSPDLGDIAVDLRELGARVRQPANHAAAADNASDAWITAQPLINS